MEAVIIVQSAVIVLLAYYTYYNSKDINGLKSQLDWIANEIFAIKKQVNSVFFQDMSADQSIKRKPAVKPPVTKSRKDKK